MQSMEIPDATLLHIETLDGGSPIGGASAGLIIELLPEVRAMPWAQRGASSVVYKECGVAS